LLDDGWVGGDNALQYGWNVDIEEVEVIIDDSGIVIGGIAEIMIN
jgi:hypothetical protein